MADVRGAGAVSDGGWERSVSPHATAWFVDALLGEAAAAVRARDQRELLEDAGAIRAAEHGRLSWQDRWATAAGQGSSVHVRLSGGVVIHGAVVDAGLGLAVLVADDGRCSLVNTEAVIAVSGLPLTLSPRDSAAGDSPVNLTWGIALRACLGRQCVLHLGEGSPITGVPLAVGADALDLRTVAGEVLAIQTRSIVALGLPASVLGDLGSTGRCGPVVVR